MKRLSVLFITVLVVISIAKLCFASEKFNLNKDNTSINFNASHLFLGQERWSYFVGQESGKVKLQLFG